MIPYEFNKPSGERRDWHSVSPGKRPHTPIIDLHRLLHRELGKRNWQADASEILSRTAKSRLARALWPAGPVYKQSGWAFDFRPAFRRFVVLAGPRGVHLVYAPDPRSIKKHYYLHTIEEVHQITNEVAEEYRAVRA